MIHVITGTTKRFYEAKVKEAGKVPWLETQLQEAEEDVAMWKAQSDDYQQQRDQERQRTDELTRELRELQSRLDGQQAEFDQQLDEAREPVLELFTDLLDRLKHPVQGGEFRKELALRVLETWAEKLTDEDHATPMGLILRVITDTKRPDEDRSKPQLANPQESAPLPPANPETVRQMRDAALLKGPDPFPGVG